MRSETNATMAPDPAGHNAPPPWTPGAFRPPAWLAGPHLQTVAGRLLRERGGRWFRERLDTPDGDFLDLDFGLPAGARSGRPFVLILHGLEGSSASGYVVESARQLGRAGLLPIALNFRSRGGEPNRRPRGYHSGETGDLAHVVETLAARFAGVRFGLLGFSLGGNVLLKYLGERGADAPGRLACACAVSVPLDLAGCAARLERRGGRAYGALFLRSLKRSLRAKAALFPDAYDLAAGLGAQTLRAFDDAVTAPVHGFRDAAEYYERSSAERFVTGIRLPTLLLQAADDPIVPAEALARAAAAASPWLSVARTERGGHLGFVERVGPRGADLWAEREAARFLAHHLGVEAGRSAGGSGAPGPPGSPTPAERRAPWDRGAGPRSAIGGVLALAAPAALAAAALACAPATPREPTDPEPATGLRLVEVARGLESPVHATAPAGDPRLFVVEQAGRIVILRDGARLPRPFLDIRDRVGSGGERGLLSVAFHPRYTENGLLFVNYTDRGGDTRVERVRVTADPDSADPGSARLLLHVRQPFSNHNGGHLVFGPDGRLYVGMGDGGSAGDPRGHGQNPETLLGALLRLDVDAADPYAAPDDNPFAGDRAGRDEIWAIGVRNPWRLAFDPAGRHLYLADVGQNRWEEISVVPAAEGGLNFGWNRMEGGQCFRAPACRRQGLVLPAVEYDHGEGCSVTGGVVYRGALAPSVNGHYFFSDYCSGWLRSFRWEGGRAVEYRAWTMEPPGSVTSFGEDGRGEMYVITHQGRVLRLEEE